MTEQNESPSTWEEDQKDPDNWLEIPDFGVQPADVLFKGFANPIVGPRDLDETDARHQIRRMVKIARHLARKTFTSMAELRESSLSAGEKLWPEPSYETPDDVSLTAREKAAIRYLWAMRDFEKATRHKRYQFTPPINALAFGAVCLMDWLIDAPLDLHGETLRRMRDGASLGGRRGAETRRARAKVPSPQVLRAEREKLLAAGTEARSVAGKLSTKYGCTADHIRKTLEKRD